MNWRRRHAVFDDQTCGSSAAGDRSRGDRWVPIDLIARPPVTDLLSYIRTEPDSRQLEQLYAAASNIAESEGISSDEAEFDAPFRHPRMIWGIGLNYSEHAHDLHAGQPEQPGSFIKADHTVIGPNENIVIPDASSSGQLPKPKSVWSSVERRAMWLKTMPCLMFSAYVRFSIRRLRTSSNSIHGTSRGPRTSKHSSRFGPEIVTLDELPVADLNDTRGDDRGVRERDSIKRRRQHEAPSGEPDLFPQSHDAATPRRHHLDGTPGAGVIVSGDIAEARVQGLAVLRNPVA